MTDREKDKDDEPGEKVTLSTLHGAKGLEFSIVYFMGVEEGLLPHDRIVNPHANDISTTDIAEERRLCYVGMTRAKDQLILTRAKTRAVQGRPQPRAVSRFLEPVPDSLIQSEDLTAPLAGDQAKERLAQIRAMLDDRQ